MKNIIMTMRKTTAKFGLSLLLQSLVCCCYCKVWFVVVVVAKFGLLLLLQRRRPSISNSHMHYILELHDCQLTLVFVFLSSVFKAVFVVLSKL